MYINKTVKGIAAVCLLLVFLSGCEDKTGPIQIDEKMFITHTNEIYLNSDRYEGRTIAYEGILVYDFDEAANRDYYYVIRMGPGCCGYDATAGFEVAWDDEFPDEDQWVAIEGILECYDDAGIVTPRLNLASLEVKEEWGEKFVYQ